MAHFGVICPPVAGHINPFLALSCELQRLGHQVTFFHMADLEAKVSAECVGFHAIGASDHPLGSLPQSLAQLGRLSGLAALRFTIQAVEKTTEMICRDAPAAIRGSHVDMLLVDQTEPAGASIAEYLGLPFITVCNALPLHEDPAVPPPFTPWSYRESAWARLRNRLGYTASRRMLKPVGDVLAAYRREWGLERLKSHDDSHSSLAQLTQLPAALDYPRPLLPEVFHHVGPLRFPPARAVSFPWSRVNRNQPLVYASLGTLQNGKQQVFHAFAEACQGLDVQLVISHAYGLSPEAVASLPGTPLVVNYAPQLEVLAQASLTLTHAGLNTVLDSLANGVPLLAVPITYEQPAIAERVRYTGAGEVLPLSKLQPERLRSIIQTLLSDPKYTQRARAVAQSIQSGGGVRQAARIVLRALETGKPVRRSDCLSPEFATVAETQSRAQTSLL